MIENRMVIDRAWPADKPMSREDRIDALTRDTLFRDARAFLSALSPDDARELLLDVLYFAWRFGAPDTPEWHATRLHSIRRELSSAIETWAENEAEREE